MKPTPGASNLLCIVSQEASASSSAQSAVAKTLGICLQEDGTLDSILEDRAPLEMILEALCGVSRAKEQNDDVRVALAESIELLVSQSDTVPLTTSSRAIGWA